MATAPPSKSTFSPRSKWAIGFQVALLVLVVFSVVVMVNYLSRDYFLRLHLSARTDIKLSSRTLNLVRSVTNQVNVILYYDKEDDLYSTIADLLKEYQRTNPRIVVQTVDYLRDPAAAERVKADYKQYLAAGRELVVFDCEHRVKVVLGKALSDYAAEPNPDAKDGKLHIRRVAFKGEVVFTSMLLAVTSPKPLRAYFLTGHGEGACDNADDKDNAGFRKLTTVLQQSYAQVEPLSLLGTNGVPTNCDLLVIAGPTKPLWDTELQQIEQYLSQGGRLLALFNYVLPLKEGRATGLESLLAKWGVEVTSEVIQDPNHSRDKTGPDVIVSSFGKHPVVNPLLSLQLQLVYPRAVGGLKPRGQATDAPRVENLFFSSPESYALGDPSRKRSFPLAVAVEKGAIPGVVQRGVTRIVVAGDSLFLGNEMIEAAANRDFASCAVNWLLDRTQLLEGLAPRPVDEYRLVMTNSQLQKAQWMLLAGMPGAVMLVGGLVWLRRRR